LIEQAAMNSFISRHPFEHQPCRAELEAVRLLNLVLSASEIFFNGHPYAVVKLIGHRWYVIDSLVERDTFDSPHREENLCQPDVALSPDYHLNPIVESVQVYPAQEHSRRRKIAEQAP
jgi:hypothetical protein